MKLNGLVLFVCMSYGGICVAAPRVNFVRVPDQGLQPEAQVSADGVTHLLYFNGEAGAGNLYYTYAKPSRPFAKSIRVNQKDNAAVAAGTIRGAHLALGKDGRAHVAWMGSKNTKSTDGVIPMLYARQRDDRSGFEPEKNLLVDTGHLDGGGSIAADAKGRVFVAWHGLSNDVAHKDARNESLRGVWSRTSTDEGKAFGPEIRADASKPVGACGCCGMRVGESNGAMYVLYRSAGTLAQRDMRILMSSDGKTFKSELVDRWSVKTCPMSSSSILGLRDGVAIAWETKRRVNVALVGRGKLELTALRQMPLQPNGGKHPVMAVNKDGFVLVVWAEGTGWKRGGTVAWRLFDPTGKPVERSSGQRPGLPAWSKPAVAAMPDGHFKVFY